MEYFQQLKKFLLQARDGGLKTKEYTKTIGELSIRVSFGQGGPARVPWIAFLHDSQNIMDGIYPVLLYFKSLDTLIFAYGVSETSVPAKTWGPEIMDNCTTIDSYLEGKQDRYGSSFVYKSYVVSYKDDEPQLINKETGNSVTSKSFEKELEDILDTYNSLMSQSEESASEVVRQEGTEDVGEFGLEAQLEDFIVENWDNLKFVEGYDIYEEEGKVIGQQYVTDLGRMDILAKKKEGPGWLVIELKKGKPSDKVVGQINHYMGYVKNQLADEGEEIKGLIIAGEEDKRILYAIDRDPDVMFLTYKVEFKVEEPKLTL